MGPAAIAEHALDCRGLPLAALGSGLDHHAFQVGDLVVRVGAPGGEVIREATLLRLVGERLAIPVPQPRFADPVRGVLAYPLLPGRPLLGRTPPADAAARLGQMLAELHAIDPAGVAVAVNLADPPDQLTGPPERHVVGPIPVNIPADPRDRLTGPPERHVIGRTPVDIPVEVADPRKWLVDLAGPPELLRVLHADPPPTSTERVLAHADLGAEHLLAADGQLTGVIDWSDAAVTDPALDFARLYRDFGPAFLDEALRAYGRDSPAFRRRITFFARCAALEDLAYGHPAYTRAAARSLTWLFPA